MENQNITQSVPATKISKPNPVLRLLRRNWDFVILALLTAYVWIFCYGPAFTLFLLPVWALAFLLHGKVMNFFAEFKENSGVAAVCAFAFPAVIMLGAYLLFGIHPVGDMSVLVLDLNGQYVYYHENLWDVCHGNGSFFISWSRNLTGEIMGIYAYYLASPFTMIVMLLPRSFLVNSLLIMQLMKVGSAGLVFYIYIRRMLTRHYKTEESNININSLIFAVLYALMSYMVVELMDPMWLDGLILLPLICYGIEKLIEEGRLLWVAIPLAAMFIANFYIGWMLAIFSCVYFLVYYFTLRDEQGFRFKDFFVKGVGFAVSGLTAALISAVVLVPLYYSLSLGKLEFTDPSFSLKTQFDIADFFTNMLPKCYDTVRPEGTPVIYCGIIVLILVPLFFMNSKISLRTKIGYGVLASVLMLSMYISTVDLVWHGLQVPNWLPYRYSFIFSFVMLIMAAQSFEKLDGVSFKEIGGVLFGLLVYVIYIDKQDYDYIDTMNSVWIAIVGVIIYSLIIYTYKKKHSPIALSVFLLMVVIGEMVDGTYYTLTKINKDVVYSKYSSYGDYISQGREYISEIKEKDDGVYRIEKNFHRTVNDAMALNSFGLSHSSSTLNEKVISMLEDLGFSCGGHYIKYKGETPITDAVFGVKYVISKEDPVDYPDILFSKDVKTKTSTDTWTTYVNPNALPIGFLADEAITKVEIGGNNPFENQNKLMSSLLSPEHNEYFKRVEFSDWDKTYENVTTGYYSDHKKYTVTTEGLNSQIEYHLKAPTADPIFMYFPAVYERKVNLWLNEEFVDVYFEGGNKVIKNLGRFEPGEEFLLTATIIHDKNETLYQDEFFYYLDEELFNRDIEKLKAAPAWNITSFAEDHVVGTVTADKAGVLFTTITNEPGWTVLVDGQKAEIVECAGALIGVNLTEGTHTVEMKFIPHGFTIGLIGTVCGIVAAIVMAIINKRRRVVLGSLVNTLPDAD